jgi:hypothetical protein
VRCYSQSFHYGQIFVANFRDDNFEQALVDDGCLRKQVKQELVGSQPQVQTADQTKMQGEVRKTYSFKKELLR